MDKDQEKTPPWKTIVYDYTQETTMHGIRFITLPTRYIIRRLAWILLMLGSLTLFIYLVYWRLDYLWGHPKAVNVEVTYADELLFPSVTICNENRFRLTATFNKGLYDLFVNDLKLKGSEDNKHTSIDGACEDEFTFIEDICNLPNRNVVDEMYSTLINDTTRKTCKYLCSGLYNSTCSSIFYNSKDLSCFISAYTGYYYDPKDSNCINSPVEFYARTRCTELEIFDCNFEKLDCPLFHNITMEDQWKVVMASSYQINKDNTLNMGAGHYLYLLETERRPGYRARIMTSYMDVTGKCLAFMYWRLGSDPGLLYVYVRNEEQMEFLLNIISGDEKVNDWRSKNIKLPTGIYQIIIEGERGMESTSGLAIDDISLNFCSDSNECLKTRLGKEYRGTQSIEGCREWKEEGLRPILGEKLQNLPEERTAEAENYCRNIPDMNWNLPRCYKGKEPQTCLIKYCECKNDSFACVSDSFCLPLKFTCDGVEDCNDGSDERIPCYDKLHIDCDFEEAYICGFQSKPSIEGMSYWKRFKGPGMAKKTSPKADSQKSLMGWYMTTDSRATGEGDNIVLYSPLQMIQNNTVLSFWVHMMFQPIEHTAKLTIYLAAINKRPERILFKTSATTNGWVKYEVCLPKGNYGLVISATAGRTYESDIALDNMYLSTGDCTPEPEPELIANGSANCRFNTKHTFCNWITYSTSAFAMWERAFVSDVIPKANTNKAAEGCSADFVELTGTITSPGYPENYPNNVECIYRIIMPEGFQVVIIFNQFEVEYVDECFYDSLVIELKKGESPESSNTVKKYSKMCGTSYTGTEYTQNANIAILTFLTDSSDTRLGFSLSYTAKASDNQEFSALVRFNGISTFIKHTAWMISNRLPITTQCLRARIYVGTSMTISFEYKLEGYTKIEEISHIGSTLGKSFHNVEYGFGRPIEETGETGRLVIAVELPTEPKLTAAGISFINVSPGLCLETSSRKLNNYTEEKLQCYFDRRDNCGFLDMSPGRNKWMPYKSEVYGFLMTSNLNHLESVLITPLVQFDQPQCLTVNFRIDSPDPNLDLTVLRGLHIFSLQISSLYGNLSQVSHLGASEQMRPYQWNSLHMNLDPGTYHIKIAASFSKWYSNVFIQLDSVLTTPGTCNSAPSIGVSCKFVNVDVCGYTIERSVKKEDPVWYREHAENYPYNYIFQNATTFNGSDNWFITFGDVIDGNAPSVPSILYSPETTFEKATPVQFWFSGYKGSVDLFLYRNSFLSYLGEIRPPYDAGRFTWHSRTVCVPAGVLVKIAFIGHVKGNEYVAIDDVSVNNKTSCNITEQTGLDVQCDFLHKDLCGYIIVDSGTDMRWEPSILYPLAIDVEDFNVRSMEVHTLSKGEIVSLGYPSQYSNNVDHLYVIYLDPNSTIDIEFFEFDIERHSTCEYDSLEVGYVDYERKSLDRYELLCGSSLPPRISMTGTIFYLRLKSDNSVVKFGFRLEYDSRHGPPQREKALYATKVGVTEQGNGVIARLFSPLVPFPGSVCVTLSIFINASIVVNMYTDKYGEEYKLLYRKNRVTITNERLWNQIKLPINKIEGTQYQLEYEVRSTDKDVFDAVILSDVKVDYGNCLTTDISWPESCNFSDVSQCDFIGKDWHRVEGYIPSENATEEELGIFMQTELFNQQETTTMMSSLYSFSTEHCLSFWFNLDSSSLRLTISASFNDSTLNNALFGATESTKTWNTGLFDIPQGISRIVFRASLVSHAFNLPRLVGITRLNFTEGACEQQDKLTTTQVPLGVSTPSLFIPRMSRNKDAGRGKVLDFMGDQSILNITKWLGHQPDNLIHSCEWQGKRCNMKFVNPEFTEKGYCMSFNKHPEEAIYTNQTGSEFGVRLILNIEQYEHLTGFSVDAGIKVHLHARDDISSVTDLGFAVAPGAHALAGISHTTSKSLPHPFGSCLEWNDREVTSYPGRNYTKLRCQRDCFTKSMVDTCHCRSMSMPGDTPMCDLNQFLDCQIPWESANGTDSIGSCDCPDACNINNYMVELSGSQLSGLSVQSLLSEEKDKIQASFVKALEVKHRVEESLLEKTTLELESTIAAYGAFMNSVQFNIVKTATSITDRIQDAIVKMQALGLSETRTVLNSSLILQQKYLTFRDPAVQYIIGYSEQAAKDVALLRDILDMEIPDQQVPPGWIFAKAYIARDALRDLNLSLTVEKEFKIPPEYREYIPQDIFGIDISKTCNDSRNLLLNGTSTNGLPKLIKKLATFVKELRENGFETDHGIWSSASSNQASASSSYFSSSSSASSSPSPFSLSPPSSPSSSSSNSAQPSSADSTLSSFPVPVPGHSSYIFSGADQVHTNPPLPPPDWLTPTTTPSTSASSATTPPTIPPASGMSTSVDLASMSNTMIEIIRYMNCTTQYKNFLDEVTAWLADLKSIHYVPNFDFENMLRQFQADIKWLETLKDEYLSMKRTKLSLAQIITGSKSSSLVKNIETEFSNINAKILNPLTDFTSSASSEVAANYIKMLKYAARFKDFFMELDIFEGLAKSISILRSPIPNIETPQIITYTLQESEIYTIWPTNQPVKSFLNGMGEDIIHSIIKDYFNVLSSELNKLSLNFGNLKQDFEDNMTALKNSMQEFIDSSAVGEDFVMENFLKLDIYFGELKYEQIEQQPAYGALQFFSEMGGYMGLLLGGSVITVLELMDMFIYNMLIKMVNARKDRQVSPDKEDNSVQSISKNTIQTTMHGPPAYNSLETPNSLSKV